ncbi:MAG: type II toxin-antitoxin system VapC family toxin [Candidatus Sumerlaeota bacterium]|nr:type II toxin-antitoxin system VapC family toxin [Candidatus Sumerlaeota bacterium]
MGVLIDSDVLIGLERRDKDVGPFIRGREDEEVFLSVISASELLHGVYRATSAHARAKRLAFVEGALASIPILEIDLATARRHAQLWSDLLKRGRMIGVHDSWLAATCLAHGLTLVTGNKREFARVAGLQVEAWT